MRYLLLFLLLPVPAIAQHRISIAAEADCALKFNLWSKAPDQCNLLTDNGILFGVKIQGADPNSLGFYGSAGIAVDQLRFPLRLNNIRFDINRYYIPLRGLILFPTRYESLKIMAGIGLDLNIGLDAAVRSRGSASYFTLDGKKAANDIQGLAYRAIPSMQAGAAYELDLWKRKWAVQVLLKQAVLQLFKEQYTLPYDLIVGAPLDLKINPQPTELVLGLVYFL